MTAGVDLSVLGAAVTACAAVWVELRARHRILERAGWKPAAAPARAARAPGLRSGSLRIVAALCGLAVGSMVGGPPLGLAGAAVGWAIPRAVRRRAEQRREEQLES